VKAPFPPSKEKFMQAHRGKLFLVAAVALTASCSSSSPPGGANGSGGSSNSGSGGKTASGGTSGGSSGGTSGGSSGGTSGGSSGGTSGGSSGGSSGSTCTATSNVTACGGMVTGKWTVMSGCVSVSGDIDLQTLFALSCKTGQVSGSLQVTGTFTANTNGTFTDETMTTGTEIVKLPKECLILSNTPVTCDQLDGLLHPYYDSASCKPEGEGCTCTGIVNQKGSMGLVTGESLAEGNYTTASNTINITQDKSAYDYCVSGSKLTVTPKAPTTGPKIAGTVVLQSSGSATGSGGMLGNGGSSGGGGKGSGGSMGSGGAAGGGTPTGGKGGAGGAGPGTGSGGMSNPGTRGMGPCDIYAAANMPCGAAYSTIRALLSTYNGPLYQVRTMSSATNTGEGGMLINIGMLPDGYADAAAQDTACAGTVCSISKLYDQTGNGNDLIRASAGPAGNGTRTAENDYEAVADKVKLTAGGHSVYGLYIQKYGGYRTMLNVKGKGIPLGNKDQGIYMLVDGNHYGGACCWDFGSVSPDPKQYVTMNTLFFGTITSWGTGAGSGPWFMGDFEGGVWAGGSGAAHTNNPMNPTMKGFKFALGILHTPAGKYALRMADTSTATDLTTAYDGASPKTWGNAGGIGLGIGGDNSNNSEGTFWEGAVTNGAPSNATDLAVMKNIQAVGYK